MTKKQAIQLFEKQKVRTIWDDEQEKWYFCVVDVVEVLTDSANPQTYWRVLKNRLKKEGNETVTNCNALKMRAADGKMRLTDVADSEQLFRLIQSIPSPKAEPFKLWMAQVASQRLDQMQDPELSIDQAIIDYKRLGYSDAWINQRIKSIEVRKELTDEWKRTGVKDRDTRGSPRRARRRVLPSAPAGFGFPRDAAAAPLLPRGRYDPVRPWDAPDPDADSSVISQGPRNGNPASGFRV